MKFLRQITFFSIFMLSSLASYASDSDFFDETFGNLQEELQTAKDSGKQGIFIFFHLQECPFCHVMETTILNQPEVIKYYKKHFLNFKVDIESSNPMVDFEGKQTTSTALSKKKFRVRATPTMMMFDLKGQPIVKYIGPTRTKQEFMWLGEYVVKGIYKTTSFTKYKREMKKALHP